MSPKVSFKRMLDDETSHGPVLKVSPLQAPSAVTSIVDTAPSGKSVCIFCIFLMKKNWSKEEVCFGVYGIFMLLRRN